MWKALVVLPVAAPRDAVSEAAAVLLGLGALFRLVACW